MRYSFGFIRSPMNRDFQLNAEAGGHYSIVVAVAECSINWKRVTEKLLENIRGKNADMSSDK